MTTRRIPAGISPNCLPNQASRSLRRDMWCLPRPWPVREPAQVLAVQWARRGLLINRRPGRPWPAGWPIGRRPRRHRLVLTGRTPLPPRRDWQLDTLDTDAIRASGNARDRRLSPTPAAAKTCAALGWPRATARSGTGSAGSSTPRALPTTSMTGDAVTGYVV